MKARLLTVLLVSSLVLAVAAPLALAQVTVSGDNNTGVQYVDCSQVQNAVQAQYGDQNAAANDNSEAAIANELNIRQSQVNACLGETPGGNNGGGGGNNDGEGGDGGGGSSNETKDLDCDDIPCAANGEGEEAAAAEKDVMASTIPEVEELPETGGPSLLALGAGLALVAGGASLIRFRR